MKYEIGDTIIVTLTEEEGKVIDILNEKMVLIEVKGVKFPAYTDQIDFPYFKMFREQQKRPSKKEKLYVDDVPKEKRNPVLKKESTGVWLQLIPVLYTDTFGDEVVDYFRIYLVNETENLLLFDYNLYTGGVSCFHLKNELLPFHDFYVQDVAIADFSDNPKFTVILELKNKDRLKADYFETSYKAKGKQIFGQFQSMKEKGAASIRHLLMDKYPEKEIPEKTDFSKLQQSGMKVIEAKQYLHSAPPARTIIDIHIEKLVHDPNHLTNAEIMALQMQEFEKWYQVAVMQNAPFLIVVHGVGNGVLRNEIHEFLKYKKEVKSFINQYHPSFGYGSTEIILNTAP
jgi:hypothetical protein